MSYPSAAVPAQLTRLVGREAEITAVCGLLHGTRLLTLTGAGGSGKTRLAAEVALRWDDGDGAAWVELAAVADPALVPGHIAASLGLRAEGTLAPEHALLHALRGRRVLLVLDNCEHVVDACATLADLLLRGEPGLRILATSREALGVAGERSWFVPPLAMPPAGANQVAALADVDAVRLFVDRARDVAPEFALTDANAAAVADICRRLDGLPLGLVLAGARVRVLTPQQIAERLASSFEVLAGRARGAPSRQQTLHATVDWSYRLLAAPEQALLQRLSVFAGGIGLDDIEAVCADEDGERPAVLDLLAALVEKSLVVMREDAGAARYSLLEPVRQYAAGRLRESGADAAVRDRHAAYFVCWAVAAEPVIYSGGSDPARFTAFDAQLGNLRAAAEWLATRADGGEAGLRLATALEWYWFIRGRSREGRQWLQTALTHTGPASALTRARALAALAMQAFCHADIALMHSAAGEAVALLRDLDAPVPLAYALTLLGAATAVLDDAEGAQLRLQEAVALGRAHDARVLVTVLTFAGFVARVRNDPAAAQRAWEEALGLARVVRLPYAALHLTAGLGRLASAQDDAALARARFGEALASHVAADDLWGLALILAGQAAVAILEDRPATAAQLLGATRSVRDGIGVPPGPDEAPLHERIAARARATLGDARFDAELRAGATLGPDDALALARTVGASPVAAAPVAPAAQPTDGASAAGPRDGSPGPARPALRVVTLGSLAIHRDGALLPPGAFAYARPRDLLLYLLCSPDGRTRSQIGLAFWPDASPAQLKNNFHVTLHHLRRAVGGDVVVAERERYRINPALDVDFDARAFERDVGAALAALRGDAPPAVVSRLREALDRYGGDFLEGESVGDWHLEPRERLRRLWEDGMLALAASLEGAGLHAEAAAAYERVVQRETLHEGAYRGLMACLARAGDRHRALRAYDRLAAVLRAELEAEPERETIALHARIRSAAPV